MDLIALTVWWALGMTGGLILWRDWKISFPDECGRCPTRAGALMIFLGGALGAILFLASLVVMVIDWMSNRKKRIGSWWSKPIC